jgi:adenosylcobinamide-GDP ribazoletransferase
MAVPCPSPWDAGQQTRQMGLCLLPPPRASECILSPSGLARDLKITLIFCTRLPLAHGKPIEAGDIARASWAMPIAGALVGLVGAAVFWLATAVGLPPWPAAALALAVTLLAAGCLHEDGLADTADGFGGGATRERKLEIMRDSRIGSYGACALVISLMLRWSALASLARPGTVALALIAAHAAARAPLPAFMRFVPPARSDGLAADAGRPPIGSVAAACVLGIIAIGFGLGLAAAIVGLLLLSLAGILMASLTVRQIGGQTGDVLGALEQINEILLLLAAATLLKV